MEPGADVESPTSSCSTPAASVRTPTTSSTARSGTSRPQGAPTRVEIVVAGCLAQKDRDAIAERAPHVDVVMGTHNVHGRSSCSHERRSPGGRSWRSSKRPWPRTTSSSPRRCPSSARRLCRLGDHPDGLRQQLRVLHRPGGPWTRDQPALRRHGRRGRARSARRRHRGHAARTERQLLRARPDAARSARARRRSTGRARPGASCSACCGDGDRAGRPLFADLLRAVGRCRASGGSATPAHIPRTCGPRRSRDGRGRRRCANTCTSRCSRGATRSWRPCTGGTPRSATWSVSTPPGVGIADLAVTTDIIVGFPGETEADAEATLEVAAEARFDGAFTFVYSPRPGTEAAESTERSCPARSRLERMERLRAVVERSSLLGNRARVGRTEEVLVEGPSRRTRSRLTGRTRQNRLVHLDPLGVCGPGATSRSRSPMPPRPTSADRWSSCSPTPTHRVRIPVAAE